MHQYNSYWEKKLNELKTEFDNVVLSPHVGGYSYHATTAGIDYTIESIKKYLSEGTPLSIVDFNKKY